jgi:hypothetical protein
MLRKGHAKLTLGGFEAGSGCVCVIKDGSKSVG